MTRTSADVRRAQKKYRCIGGPDHICNRTINPGDVYFTFTIHSPNGHKTQRYCVECAHRNHPDLLKESMESIKTPAKRRAATPRVSRMSYLSGVSRKLRKKTSLPEQFFWEQLKTSAIKTKFLQQQMIHGYVVDFWAPAEQIVVELDGIQHLSRREKDAQRDQAMRSHGILVLRFPAQIVFSDLNYVFERIKEAVETRKGNRR
jgi:very-short-patch-repair endonuclease